MVKRQSMEMLQLDPNGRVVIPAILRKALRLKPGDRLVAWVEKDRIVVRPRHDLINELKDTFRRRPHEKSLKHVLREERDEEARHER